MTVADLDRSTPPVVGTAPVVRAVTVVIGAVVALTFLFGGAD
ncbi:hypothetical protein F4560_008587 [Saccharothrix ecbatanensis]|uniref:Uncharacterized protein n=1 Tax=Saccharothrix ecbatanensis TaxID=1105145 RepID=A0A7W9HUN6_9PSEU|nr:hypothetical protein [Saccharothrix ecbatanensis]MBB5808819.1 hypothetical protein [Saccharothrix ecbatanensis]